MLFNKKLLWLAFISLSGQMLFATPEEIEARMALLQKALGIPPTPPSNTSYGISSEGSSQQPADYKPLSGFSPKKSLTLAPAPVPAREPTDYLPSFVMEGRGENFRPDDHIIPMLKDETISDEEKKDLVTYVKGSTLDQPTKNRILKFAQKQKWYPATDTHKTLPFQRKTALDALIVEQQRRHAEQQERDALAARLYSQEQKTLAEKAALDVKAAEAKQRKVDLEKATRERIAAKGAQNSPSPTTPRRSSSRSASRPPTAKARK